MWLIPLNQSLGRSNRTSPYGQQEKRLVSKDVLENNFLELIANMIITCYKMDLLQIHHRPCQQYKLTSQIQSHEATPVIQRKVLKG